MNLNDGIQINTAIQIGITSATLAIIQHQAGLNEAIIGFAGTGFAVASLLGNRLITNHHKPRQKLRLAIIIKVLALSAIATLWAPLLIAAQITLGFVQGYMMPLVTKLKHDQQRHLGKFMSLLPLGIILAQLLILGITFVTTETGTYRIIFLCAALGHVLLLFKLDGVPRNDAIETTAKKWQIANWQHNIHTPLLIRTIAGNSLWVVFPLYIMSKGGSLADLAYLFIAESLVAIIALRYIHRLHKLTDTIIITSGYGMSTLGFLILLIPYQLTAVIIARILIHVGYRLYNLGNAHLVLENKNKVRSAADLDAIKNISVIIAPLMGGVIAYLWGYYIGFVISLICVIAATIIRIAYQHQDKRVPS